MKRLTHFESSIMGLFIGVIAATYLVYLEGVGKNVGSILNFITLRPVSNLINVAEDQRLVVLFLFTVFVFIIYGFIVGLIMRKGTKIKIIVFCLIILVVVGIFLQQKNVSEIQQKQEVIYVPPAEIHVKNNNDSGQYFNETEVTGDLNGDGKDDIAFIIPREDKDRGTLYYYTVSLSKDGGGHMGTNLVFLGDGFEPQNISIENGQIVIDYINRTDKKTSATKVIYAEVVDGVLRQVKTVKTATSSVDSITKTD